MCRACADVLEAPYMLNVSYSSNKDALVCSYAIAIETKDDGEYVDKKAEKIVEFLNSDETRKLVEAYLVFSDAKEKLRKKMGAVKF